MPGGSTKVHPGRKDHERIMIHPGGPTLNRVLSVVCIIIIGTADIDIITMCHGYTSNKEPAEINVTATATRAI